MGHAFFCGSNNNKSIYIKYIKCNRKIKNKTERNRNSEKKRGERNLSEAVSTLQYLLERKKTLTKLLKIKTCIKEIVYYLYYL